jgi:site-specific DNA recombinase
MSAARAHFLKNRFYIGEVVYRGEAHAGEHASIINRPTFDAVQAKLAENARARRVRVESSPAILICQRLSPSLALAYDACP